MKILIQIFFFEIKESNITRGHDYTLVKKQSRLDVRKYSFSQRTINVWNNLSTDCVHARTVVPVMNGHPRDQAKVSVHCRWPLIRGNLTLKCVGRGIDNMAVQSRWPLTTGVAQGRYYCRVNMFKNKIDKYLVKAGYT